MRLRFSFDWSTDQALSETVFLALVHAVSSRDEVVGVLKVCGGAVSRSFGDSQWSAYLECKIHFSSQFRPQGFPLQWWKVWRTRGFFPDLLFSSGDASEWVRACLTLTTVLVGVNRSVSRASVPNRCVDSIMRSFITIKNPYHRMSEHFLIRSSACCHHTPHLFEYHEKQTRCKHIHEASSNRHFIIMGRGLKIRKNSREISYQWVDLYNYSYCLHTNICRYIANPYRSEQVISSRCRYHFHGLF